MGFATSGPIVDMINSYNRNANRRTSVSPSDVPTGLDPNKPFKYEGAATADLGSIPNEPLDENQLQQLASRQRGTIDSQTGQNISSIVARGRGDTSSPFAQFLMGQASGQGAANAATGESDLRMNNRLETIRNMFAKAGLQNQAANTQNSYELALANLAQGQQQFGFQQQQYYDQRQAQMSAQQNAELARMPRPEMPYYTPWAANAHAQPEDLNQHVTYVQRGRY